MSVASAWSMAQAMNEETLQDTAHKWHQLASVIFFLIAVGLTVAGLVVMKIEYEKRVVLGLGVLIILDATLNFARVVYRSTKVRKLQKKIKVAFHIEVDLEDKSGNFFDSALDTFANTTNMAGREDEVGANAGYVYGDAGGSAPPPPPGGYQQAGGH